MRLKPRNAPYIRHPDGNRSVMGDMIIALLPLYLMTIFYYGIRTVVMLLVSVLTCVVTEILCVWLMGRKINISDYSPVVTGLVISLLMPASIPYYVIVVACVFAIAVVKHPFGGTGENLFNPAAAGIAFAIACFGQLMFTYPAPFDQPAIFGSFTGVTVNSPAFVLSLGGVPTNSIREMTWGMMAGPMGATNILVILACLIFLVYRKTVRLWQAGSFLGAAALVAALFPRVALAPVQSMVYELLSGSILFVGIFMLNDPVTSPQRDVAKLIYGALTGVVTMLFRYFGGYEQMAVFAVLLMNATVPIFDWFYEVFYQNMRGGKAHGTQKTAKP